MSLNLTPKMAKFRKRVKGNKGKRWLKGQSSSSNPTTHKYREAAKSRFFEPITGPSMLTKEAVEKHDTFSLKRDGTTNEDDIESFGGKTFKTFDTFASDWSSCSNQSFSKFVNNFKSDSAMHKDMLAVLAAVTEVIKQNGGNESSTEYFGALMTALEAEGNTDDTLAAILNLLSMGIKSVPLSVLQAKFSETSSKIISLLSRFSDSEKTSVIRALLGCLSVLLRALDSGMWSDPSTTKVLDVLLSFITFSKPKIRKAAQHGIAVVVNGSKINQSNLAHIARHCIKLAESAAIGNVTTSLHAFTLLRDIIHLFPKKELKICCETILKMMTLNNVLVTSCGLQVLHSMFTGRPASLPAADGARLINALYDYQPPPTDSQPTQAWLAVLQQAYLFLAKVDLNLCVVNCPKLFTTCYSLFTTNRPETLTAATCTLQVVISDCLGPASRPDVLPRYQQDINKIVCILKGLFSYEYHPAWSHVLHLIAAVFKACGDTCSNILLPCLKLLVDLRDSEQFTFINELENAIGVAVKSMGPEVIIKIVPLQIDPNDKKGEFKRSWLLPVLKDNIKGSTLKIFIEHFLPLATTCKNISDQLKSQKEQIRAIGYDLLQTQIWSLLPSFANEPQDIASSFPMIAKALGGVLNSRKDLRSIVLSTLRKLISHSLVSENKEDLAVMTKFAKNYLPILFVIYTTKFKGTDEEGTRLATFETIKVYLKISTPELKKELFDRAFVKVDSAETDEFAKESILDLLRPLLSYQSKEDIENLFNKIVEKINKCENHKEQKKYFRLIEEICLGESEQLKNFLNEKLNVIKEFLTETLSKAAPSSKGPRLNCILQLLTRIDEPLPFATLILPETILCLKDINSKCRKTAFSIIEYISKTFEPKDYLHIITAGMAGNPTMISCSLLAASAIIYHAQDKITEEIEQNLLYCVGLLAVCSTREIVSSALSFIRVYIQAFPRDKVALYLPEMMKIFSKMTEDCKRHSRLKTRDILSRLCRWYGADEVTTYIPSDDEVLRVRVRNLGKIESRKKRQKEAASKASSASAPASTFSVPQKHKSIEEILAESDSDMDVDEEDNVKERNSKKNKSKVWITEDGEDIVDFTDTSVTRKITATKPGSFAAQLEKKKKKKTEFKTAPDGRLIITDDTDDEDDERETSGKRKKKTVIPGLEDSEDDYEGSDDEDAFTSYSGVGVKRPLSTANSVTSGPPMKYRAGGKGIHRPIGKALSTASSKKSRKSSQSNAPKTKTGAEYRAKRAGGDMKRKGMPSPYAYLPLRRDALNKRKRMKAMGQMKNILKSAKHGAQVGTKLRKKKQ